MDAGAGHAHFGRGTRSDQKVVDVWVIAHAKAMAEKSDDRTQNFDEKGGQLSAERQGDAAEIEAIDSENEEVADGWVKAETVVALRDFEREHLIVLGVSRTETISKYPL